LPRRARFLREVVRSVRAAVGPNYPVAVKLNSADFQRGGFEESESMKVVDMLEADGIDLLEISGGTYESGALLQEQGQRPSTLAREAFYMAYAEQVRARSKLPLMLTGGFRSRAAMEHALQSGAVDLIGLGRPLIVDPDFAQRLLRGDLERAPAIALATGVKAFDTFMQGAWYQAQLRSIARGREPNVALPRLVAALRYLIPESLDPEKRSLLKELT
jgi:2,4-dienoyl-CoA reductase-like NADH-dependent reductase (Old Yellow Enzyme family)